MVFGQIKTNRKMYTKKLLLLLATVRKPLKKINIDV